MRSHLASVLATALVLATTLVLAAGPLGAVELAPGVELIPGKFVAGTQPDGNSVILRGTDGLVVVDSGRHAEHTRAIIEAARASGLPVAVVVNTHWHLDHVGGNPLLRREFPGVKVVASGALEGAMGGFLANYRKQLDELVARSATPEAAQPFRDELAILDAGPALLPDEVVTASDTRSLAGRELEIHLETHAVTAGDLWLRDTASGIVLAGDLVTLPAPLFDTACPSRWSQALKRLAATDFKTLVPGHGAPMDRAAFTRYRTAFDALLECAASSRAKSECIEGWIRDAGDLIPDSDQQLARGLSDYYLDAVLRGPAERLGALCGEG